jgi:hypothetical protein
MCIYLLWVINSSARRANSEHYQVTVLLGANVAFSKEQPAHQQVPRRFNG